MAESAAGAGLRNMQAGHEHGAIPEAVIDGG
jgi:hypothetical protein